MRLEHMRVAHFADELASALKDGGRGQGGRGSRLLGRVVARLQEEVAEGCDVYQCLQNDVHIVVCFDVVESYGAWELERRSCGTMMERCKKEKDQQ